MLVLFDTPAGFAVFKVLDEGVLKDPDNIWRNFQTAGQAGKVLKLKHFKKFEDMTEALSAATAAVEGKVSKPLKKFLRKIAKETQEELLVADAKLGSAIKDKLNLQCVTSMAVQELMRGIRQQMSSLITGLADKEVAAFALGLAHSLSRYKLKFSPDKVDTMIIQAVCLLDDIDKELNNYMMRAREWYGWHFPELGKIVTDNIAFAKVVKVLGHRENTSKSDLSEVLPEELADEVKQAAEISMGTEVSDDDITNIHHLCDQVLQLSEYRAQLYDYLRNRMMAIAPNLTVLVGELVGARLISHAGSLLNLAKHPSSTVQILGAEKALFRALKTKHDTPKYGLIYHASLVGQANAKLKGKVSRMLAAKASLAIRVDALGESTGSELGAEHRANLEARLKMLETGEYHRLAGSGKKKAQTDKYVNKSEVRVYDPSADSTLPSVSKKRKADELAVEAEGQSKKKRKVEVGAGDEGKVEADAAEADDGKKKKKVKAEHVNGAEEAKKAKKKKSQEPAAAAAQEEEGDSSSDEEDKSAKKKNRKKLAKAAAAAESAKQPQVSKKSKKVKVKTESD